MRTDNAAAVIANGEQQTETLDRTAFAEPVIFKLCYPKKPTQYFMCHFMCFYKEGKYA